MVHRQKNPVAPRPSHGLRGTPESILRYSIPRLAGRNPAGWSNTGIATGSDRSARPITTRADRVAVRSGSQGDPPVPDILLGDGVIRRATQLISHSHRIEHAPQHVELELQNLQHALLAFDRDVVRQGDAQTMLDVAPRLE